ncbi:MAG: carboxypeptidase regulatory-like domain-containing protein [Blastocatellia bacterium]|nr:carboxypeptidase regulatory-like domain-containing protein [Blastocatellia bacterium]MBN8721586.1 carboxypeptidase regulatory-like domain-containing protein [Acidobacteriota bacterium]
MHHIITSLFKLVFFLAITAPILTFAQSAGSTSAAITGRVTDESGASIAGATILLTQTDTNLSREAVSSTDGLYTLSQLPPGAYEVSVSADGFKSLMGRISLLLGISTRSDFVLTIGATSEVVEVVASDPASQENIESSTSVEKEKITVLPINRREFLDFALTAARVTVDRVPVQGATATSGLSFNGQSARFNNITIDGLSNNDIGSGSVRATFSQEAVQEFQIITDNYSAEFGRSLGGIVNIVTKGGGNQYHSTIFFLNRNDEISARDTFAATKADFSQYQFGATLSGPIKKDKLFFFSSFERLSVKQNNIVTISDDSIAAARRQGFAIRNGAIPFSVATTNLLGRLDGRLSPNDTFYLRYNFGGAYNGAFQPFGALFGEDTGSIQNLTDNTVVFNNVYVNTRLNLINETRFLYGHRDQTVVQVNQGPGISIAAPEGNILFGSFLSRQPRVEDIFQIVNNVSLTRGRHQIKFGIDFNYTNLPDKKSSVPFFDQGNATFSPIDFSALTGIPNLPVLSSLQAFDPTLRTPQQRAFLTAASALIPALAPGFPANLPLASLPLPLLFVQGFGDTRLIIPTKFFTTFVQDDFRLKPNLLIRAGLRYDINRVRFMPTNNGNFSPRIGFAFRPTQLPKLTIRGSYGLFFSTPLVGAAFFSQLSTSGALKIPVIPFPFSILPYNTLPGRRFPISNDIPAGINFEPQLTNTLQFEPNVRNSYTQQTNFGLDYLVNNSTVASIGYTYVRGVKLFNSRQINPVVRPIPGDLLGSLRTGRSDPTTGQITQFETANDSYFSALTIAVNRRFTGNFGVLVSYTFAKAIDNAFDLRTDVVDKPVNPLRIGDERSLSVQDVRSRFVLSGLWRLNYTKNPILRDFQLSSIITLNSGRPFNLLAGADLNMDGDSGDGDRPFFQGVSLPRNAGITGGFANVDVRLSRTVKLGETYEFQGFIEAFNLFNRVNISEIGRIFPADAQGNFQLPARDGDRFIATSDRFRNAFAPRQFQFGFRLVF